MSQLSAAGLPLAVGGLEVQRLREELMASNLRLARWKEGITQARNVNTSSYVTPVCYTCDIV